MNRLNCVKRFRMNFWTKNRNSCFWTKTNCSCMKSSILIGMRTVNCYRYKMQKRSFALQKKNLKQCLKPMFCDMRSEPRCGSLKLLGPKQRKT